MAKKKEKVKEPVNLGDLQSAVCDIAQELEFLGEVFRDPNSIELNESECTGLGLLLGHITRETLEVLTEVEHLERERGA